MYRPGKSSIVFYKYEGALFLNDPISRFCTIALCALLNSNGKQCTMMPSVYEHLHSQHRFICEIGGPCHGEAAHERHLCPRCNYQCQKRTLCRRTERRSIDPRQDDRASRNLYKRNHVQAKCAFKLLSWYSVSRQCSIQRCIAYEKCISRWKRRWAVFA